MVAFILFTAAVNDSGLPILNLLKSKLDILLVNSVKFANVSVGRLV